MVFYLSGIIILSRILHTTINIALITIAHFFEVNGWTQITSLRYLDLSKSILIRTILLVNDRWSV